MTTAQPVPESRRNQTTTLLAQSINPPAPTGTRLWTKPVTPSMTAWAVALLNSQLAAIKVSVPRILGNVTSHVKQSRLVPKDPVVVVAVPKPPAESRPAVIGHAIDISPRSQ